MSSIAMVTHTSQVIVDCISLMIFISVELSSLRHYSIPAIRIHDIQQCQANFLSIA